METTTYMDVNTAHQSVQLRQVAGAASRAGDAHSSGTPDLTLYLGPLCLNS